MLQMLIQERLQLILKMHSISPSIFADKLGVQRSNVSHVLSGRNKPSLDFLEKIVTHFPRVNAHWLITGVMHDNGQNSKKAEEEIVVNSQSEKTDYTSTIKLMTNSDLKRKKNAIRIVEFYDDNTFSEYLPSN
jgi:transcriptional regulator with XRE-family HTH domain